MARRPVVGPHSERVETTLTPATAGELRALARSAGVPMSVIVRDLVEHALNDLSTYAPRRTA